MHDSDPVNADTCKNIRPQIFLGSYVEFLKSDYIRLTERNTSVIRILIGKVTDLIGISVCLCLECIQNLIFRIMRRLITDPGQDQDKNL